MWSGVVLLLELVPHEDALLELDLLELLEFFVLEVLGMGVLFTVLRAVLFDENVLAFSFL
jgi:hypothetical protein